MSQFTTMSRITNPSDIMGYNGVMSSLLRHHEGDDDGPEYTQKPFGKALRQLRKRRGLTQGQLAALVGAAGHSTVATWEMRADPLDDDEMMEELARVLGVSVDYLAEGKVPSVRAAAKAFDDAIEELAQAFLTGEALQRAMKLWKAVTWLPEEDMAALDRVVEAMAEKERMRRAMQEGTAGTD